MDEISQELKAKLEELSKKINKPYEWVYEELNKGPFADSSIWELMKEHGI